MYNSHPPTKIIFGACMRSRKTEFHGGPPGQHEALKSRCEQTVSQRFSMQVLSRVAALGQALRVRSARAAYRGLQNCLLRIGDDDDHCCCCCCQRCCCCFYCSSYSTATPAAAAAAAAAVCTTTTPAAAAAAATTTTTAATTTTNNNNNNNYCSAATCIRTAILTGIKSTVTTPLLR